MNKLVDWLKISIAAALILTLGWIEYAPAQQSVVIPATTAQLPIAGTVAARTTLVTGQSGKSIYVTGLILVPVATSAVTLSAGTGTNCGTGTALLSGVMTFAAGQTVNHGAGNGAVIVVPQGNDLCITVGTAAAPGTISFSIF